MCPLLETLDLPTHFKVLDMIQNKKNNEKKRKLLCLRCHYMDNLGFLRMLLRGRGVWAKN